TSRTGSPKRRPTGRRDATKRGAGVAIADAPPAHAEDTAEIVAALKGTQVELTGAVAAETRAVEEV
ncbi:MAG TPA: hypothetical protein VFF73_30780, partial [Planctomycetota bacterium]|nr:hypothetical protein [Planctomycetota bacterium]